MDLISIQSVAEGDRPLSIGNLSPCTHPLAGAIKIFPSPIRVPFGDIMAGKAGPPIRIILNSRKRSGQSC